jgi:hypothetical protein
MANIDYKKKAYLRTGDFNCFCEKLHDDQGLDKMKEFKFPLDDGQYCEEWYINMWKAMILPQFVGGVMGCINVVTELTVRLGTYFIKRPLNETESNINNMRGIAWQQYINLALIFPFIYMN